MQFLKPIVIGLALLLATGCGGTNETSTKVVVPPAVELLKSALNDLASKGEPVGSGGMLLQQYVDKIGIEDAAKAKALSPLVDSIMSLKDPAKIKAKANEMLKLL